MPDHLSFRDAVRILGSASPTPVEPSLGQVVRLGKRVLRDVAEEGRGPDRAERAEAVEAVCVVAGFTAYLEAVIETAGSSEEFGEALGAASIGALLVRFHGSPSETGDRGLVAAGFSEADFLALGRELTRVLTPSEARSSDPYFRELSRRLLGGAVERAVTGQRTLLDDLALAFPELRAWTSDEHDRSGEHPLLWYYRNEIDRISTGPGGFGSLTLAESYVEPPFRTGHGEGGGLRWDETETGEGLLTSIASFLASAEATNALLLVLGDPGSGKSALTKILAGTLPSSGFFPVRVPLRDVPSDADPRTQIEMAVWSDIGERLSWFELASQAGGRRRVVILDGLDEMPQDGLSRQASYLEQIARFQEREAERGRPTAVVVTVRSSAVSFYSIPYRRTRALRLEPFDIERVSRLLSLRGEREPAARRLLAELDAEDGPRWREFVGNPLLLLALTAAAQDRPHVRVTSRTDLYERVLRSLVARDAGARAAHEPSDAPVSEELDRLSVAALGMFNRGRTWVTRDELAADLEALLPYTRRPFTGREPLFRQAHQAFPEAEPVFEFVHASFGEFLTARFIATELEEQARLSFELRRRPVDVSTLRNTLAFAPLPGRAGITDHLGDLLRDPSHERKRVGRLVLDLWRRADEDESEPRALPVRRGTAQRYSTYTLNLLTLLLLVSDEPVSVRGLFGEEPDPIGRWTSQTRCWRAFEDPDALSWLSRTVGVRRVQGGAEPDLLLSLDREPAPVPATDLSWHDAAPAALERRRWAYLAADREEDLYLDALRPFARMLGEEEFLGVLRPEGGAAATAAGAGARLLLAGLGDPPPGELEREYRSFADLLPSCPDPVRYAEIMVQQLARDERLLSPEFREEMTGRARRFRDGTGA